MHKIFINEFGRLRSGWRVLVFVLAFTAIWFVLGAALWVAYSVVLAVAPGVRARIVADVIFRITLLAAALGAGYLCARFLEGLPWRSLGLTLHSGWFRDLLIGSVVGFVSLAIGVGVAASGGALKFQINDASALALGRSLLGSAGLLFVAAFAEEAMFRGYPLQTLSRAKLVWLGVLLTSVPFGIAHLSNPNVDPVAIVNTVVAGVWLAVAYLRTRSLWLPQGVHWAWNWALGCFFGLPISGAHLVSNPVLQATDLGPDWLTGGSYGIEGGVAGTVALVVSTVFLWWAPWLRPTPELEKLTSEENPLIPSPVLTIRPVE